jgi:signal peptidase II
MTRFVQRWSAAAIIAVVVLVADQLSKAAVARNLAPGDVRVAIPNLVAWSYVENVHGAYGLFGDRPALLIALAVAVLVLFGYAFSDLTARSALARIAYGGIVAGALGNVIDRTHYGYVIDFISIKPMPFFEVFNVADAAICCGVALLVIASFRRGRASSEAGPGEPSLPSG